MDGLHTLSHESNSQIKIKETLIKKLLKIAARVVKSAGYKYFKLCSSCPYKKEFYETLENIYKLRPQMTYQLA